MYVPTYICIYVCVCVCYPLWTVITNHDSFRMMTTAVHSIMLSVPRKIRPFSYSCIVIRNLQMHPSSGDPPLKWWKFVINAGKVIQKNQMDATITIYWSTRSAQHVSGKLLPTFRSVRLRFLQHMVSCCCGRLGFGERQRGTTCTVWRELFDWEDGQKDCPKHVELIL